MSQEVSDACDELLSLGILNHEYGIPRIWSDSPRKLQDHDLEQQYYKLNLELASELNKLVYLNKEKELLQLDPAEISAEVTKICEDGRFSGLSLDEIEHFLHVHTNTFKTTLLNDFFAQAQSILRSIYHDNSSLADTELSVLNNLKKLYSQYNDHPANISRLIEAYNEQNRLLQEEAEVVASLEHLFSTSVSENMKKLHDLNQEYLVLQNTFQNQVQSQTDASSRVPSDQKKLRSVVATLARRISTIRILGDFLPNLVLCQSSNWYSDAKLRAIVDECQEIGEEMPDLAELGTNGRVALENILRIDFDEVAAAIESLAEKVS